MTLAESLAVAAGIVFEILLLWEGSQRRQDTRREDTRREDRAAPAPSILGRFTAGEFSRLQVYAFLFVLVAWALIGLSSLLKIGLPLAVGEVVYNLGGTAWFGFLFVFGLVWPRLMPRVNEQTILITNLVILPGFIASQGVNLWLAALALPTLGMLLLIAFPRALQPVLKALMYLWYLVCLLIATVLSNFDVLITSRSLSLVDTFILGQSSTFLLLNALFLVRFFLMLSALVLPGNRRYLTETMPQLFSDEQVSTLRLLALVGIGIAVVAVNQFTGLAAPATLTNLLILLAVHGMERPQVERRVF